MGRTICIGLLIAIAGVGSYQDDEPRLPLVPVDSLPAEWDLNAIPIGFLELPTQPVDNPSSPERVQLGRKLFFDPVLSTDGTISCASCHQPEHGFASPEALAIGIRGQRTKRNAPSLLNRGYGQHFFWDGRAATLEAQALGPISSPAELGGDTDPVLTALRADPEYVAAFRSVFALEADLSSEAVVTLERVGQAIASFERTLLSGNAPVDRFRRSEYTALSREARQGMWIFESSGGCWQCHSGPNFSDEDFHNTGVSFGQADRDTGRVQFTGDPADQFKFKTPSLRDIELTPPYMHDGSLATLPEVVEFYNKGGAPNDPGLDERMKPLNLTKEEEGFLVAFLQAMTGESPATVAEGQTTLEQSPGTTESAADD